MFLCQVLLRDTHHFVALLHEIQALASEAGQTESEEAAQRVIEHVDRIAAWGGARQRAWSDYYQCVHRYLRDVVRLDPDRALSQRLRDQVASWPSTPFHLLVAAAPSIRLLRPLESRVERPAVMRSRTDREGSPDPVDPEDAGLNIETLVESALAAGARSLDGKGIESDGPSSTKQRLTIQKAFEDYWQVGGFPSVNGLDQWQRIEAHQANWKAIVGSLIGHHNISHPGR